MVLVGYWITNRIEESVLIKNSELAAYYMESFLEPNMQSLETARELSPEDYAAMQRVAADEALLRHVVEIKIWLPDGTVAFSTDKSIEGKMFDPQELTGPMQGKVGAYIDELDAEENAHERLLVGPIYEVYLPLSSRKTGKIIAVGEFYENATVLRQQLYESFVSSLAVLAGFGAMIMVVLSIIVGHGTRTIDSQRAELVALGVAQEQLEEQTKAIVREVGIAKRNLIEIDRLFRRRVGLELHDGPSQLLTFVLLSLDEISDIDTTNGNSPAEVRAQIDRTKRVAAEALKEIREISTTLFSPLGEDQLTTQLSLSAAVSQFEARTGLHVHGTGLETVDTLPDDVRQSLIRVVLEGLNNIFKHSGAKQSTLVVTKSATHLTLVLTDNGKGFSPEDTLVEASQSGRLGLLGMRYRIEILGGTLAISSMPGEMTALKIELPL